jgi:hypothetical protein
MCKLEGAEYDVAIVAEAQRNPFISARLLLIFLGRYMYGCFET